MTLRSRVHRVRREQELSLPPILVKARLKILNATARNRPSLCIGSRIASRVEKRMKLNQILAVEKGVKKNSYKLLTELDKNSQKPALYEGRARTYKPLDDEGEIYPPEHQKVQLRSHDVLREIRVALAEYFDVVFTKDVSNLEARSDLKVEGRTLIANVPVTYLLFLEKQVGDLRTMLDRMPVVDAAETWVWENGQSAFRTEPVKSAKTKKIPRNHVKAEATEHHPAQVEVYYEDVVVGYWTNIKYSGALSRVQKDQVLERVDRLLKAIRVAREEANSREVEKEKAADAIFDYLFERGANA